MLITAILSLASLCAAQVPSFFQSAYSTAPIPTVSSPTFSPVSPYSGGATTVTITQGSTPATGQTIYYCVSTTPCTPSTVYTTGIAFTSTENIFAYASASGYQNSATVEWKGTITLSLGYVQTWSCAAPGTGTNTHITCTAGANWTSGDIGVVFGLSSFGKPSATSAGTFTLAPTTAPTSGASGVLTAVPGGTSTITLTTPSVYINPSQVLDVIVEFSGSSGLDTGASAQAGWVYSYSGTSTPSVTTTGTQDAVCAFVSALSPGTGYAAGGGYTLYSISAITYSGGNTVISNAPDLGLLECTSGSVSPGSTAPTFTSGGAQQQYLGTISLVL